MSEWLRVAAIATWLLVAACLAPAAWRALRHRGRSLDPLWTMFWLMAANRLGFGLSAAFGFQVGLAASNALAVLLGLLLIAVARTYGRHDG